MPANNATNPGPTPFPEAALNVEPWPDPVIDQLGYDAHSPYVEQYWLPVVGPSSILLIRKLATNLHASPDGFSFSPAQWAVELGVGSRGGINGTLWRSIERICRFGAARRQGDLLIVRRKLAPLTSRQVDRLPEGLKTSHHAWVNQHRGSSCQPWTNPTHDHLSPQNQISLRAS